MEEHHCHEHAYFIANCEACKRARAAFLPYQNVSPHPEPASRSFQTNLGPALPPMVQIGLKEATAYGVAEGITEGIIDLLLNR